MDQANTTTIASETVQNANYRKNAIRFGLITAALFFALFLFQLYSLIRGTTDVTNAAQRLAIPIPIIIGCLIAIVLSYRGHVQLGVAVIIVTLSTLLLATNLAAEGLGLIIGVILAVILSSIVRLTLPPEWTTRGIAAALALGIIALFVDLFGPPGRLSAINPTVINLLALLILLVYGGATLFQFPRFRLRNKLVVTITGITILAVTAVIAVVSISTRQTLTNTAGATLNDTAKAQALGIGEQLSRQINSLEALALNKALQDSITERTRVYRDLSGEEIEAIVTILENEWQISSDEARLPFLIVNNTTANELTRFRETFPSHVDLILTDRQGAVVAATNRPADYDLSDEDWWQDTFAQGFGSSFVGEPYYSERWNDVLIDIAVPVRVANLSGGGSLVGGILKSAFRITPFIALLEQASFGGTGAVELHVQENIKLRRNEEGAIALYLTDPEEVAILDSLRAGDSLFANDIFYEQPSLISLAGINTLAQEPRVNRLEWYAVAYQAEEEALAPVAVQQRNNIVLGVGVILITILIAAVGGEVLTRPIVGLTETAVKVSGGDLTARVVIPRIAAEDEIGVLANAFNQMTANLQDSIEGLEGRVSERTRALETSTEVGRGLSTILSEDELVKAVVNQVRAAFNYYHVHIYLLDEEKKTLMMAGGTGEAGRQMLAKNHQIPFGQGLVGRAAAQNTAVLVADVAQDPGWLPNPLLPDTKSETAVPIAIGDEVFGVLDVQQNITNGLQESDIDLLLSIANQVASSLRNARLYDEIQQQAQQQATLNQINQQIQGAADVQTALKIAVREVGRAVGAKHTAVRLISEPEHTNGHNGHDQVDTA